MHKLEYQDAPRENLETWHRLTKFMMFGTIAIAIFLLILAAAMT